MKHGNNTLITKLPRMKMMTSVCYKIYPRIGDYFSRLSGGCKILRFLVRPTSTAPELVRMSTTFKWLFFVGIVILGSCIMYPLFWYFSPHATFRESILHGLWIPPIHFALITWLCLKMFRAGIKFVDTLFVGAGAFLILFPAGVLSMLPFSIFDMPTYTQLSLLLSIGFLEIVAFYVIVVW